MAQIDYFMTPVSPWTYLAGDRLERVAQKHDAEILLKPVHLPRIFEETGGVQLAKRHPARKEYRLQELRRWSIRSGLPLTLEPEHFPTDARPAALAIVAAVRARRDALGLARYFLAACWAAERDIAAPDVLDEGLASVGLSRADLDAECEAILERNTDEALARGVFGSPFYIVGDERFWGQDRLDDLDRYLAGDFGPAR